MVFCILIFVSTFINKIHIKNKIYINFLKNIIENTFFTFSFINLINEVISYYKHICLWIIDTDHV